MKLRPFTLVVLAVFFGNAELTSAQQAAMTDDRGIPTIAPIIQTVTDGVVAIAAQTPEAMPLNPFFDDPLFRDFFGMPFEAPQQDHLRTNVGSGVIVDAAAGYILTNHHVVGKSDSITVTLHDGRSVMADLVGSDPATDIAVIQVEANNLTQVPLGDSNALLVGDYVVAIGNPFGLGQTVTSGIVSALGRAGINPQGYEDFIQTDASINPGNSGGALITLDGRLVGINTAIFSQGGGNIGIGFAVPISMASDVMDQIITHGEVRRARLGVGVRDLTPDLAAALDVSAMQGAVITEIAPLSVADDAGLRAGDVIIAVDATQITGARQLRNLIGAMRPGTQITMRVVRDGSDIVVPVTLGRQNGMIVDNVENIPGGTSPAIIAGVVVENLSPDHPAFGMTDGVAVVAVTPQTAADRAGLMPGDVITAINTQQVRSRADLDAELAKATQIVAMTIWRDGRDLLLVMDRTS